MNCVEKYDARVDHEQTRARLRVASLKFRSLAWRCSLIDAALVFLWIFLAISPLIGSGRSFVVRALTPASVMLLCVCCALGPVAVSALRVLMVMRASSKPLRVDRMHGAVTRLRQIPCSADNPYIGWWFMAGYVGAAAYVVANVMLIAIWSLMFGVAVWLSILIVLITLMSAASVVGCTASLYDKGVEKNMRKNVTSALIEREQWARFRARENRTRWLAKKNEKEADANACGTTTSSEMQNAKSANKKKEANLDADDLFN
jgi:hypothetical protein